MKHKILSLTRELDEFASFENYSIGKSNSTKLNEYKKIIRKIINNELTERQRYCITMKYYNGQSAKEISNTLGIDKTTVYKHIRVGIKSIKKHLKIYFNV